MADFTLGTIVSPLPCVFGLGKDFIRKVSADPIQPGEVVTSRFDRDSWHKFTVTRYGHTSTYAVESAQELDIALGLKPAHPKGKIIERIKTLLAEHGLTLEDLR